MVPFATVSRLMLQFYHCVKNREKKSKLKYSRTIKCSLLKTHLYINKALIYSMFSGFRHYCTTCFALRSKLMILKWHNEESCTETRQSVIQTQYMLG